MTVNRGPGVAPIAGVGTTTLEHRLMLAGLYAENAPGVPRSGVLAQANAVLVTPRTDMSWDVGPLAAVISRTAGEGVYTPTLTGTTNVTTIPAPGTNSRWDLLYIKQNDAAKGDADNAAVIGVVNGTALASPSKPYGSVPAGALVLAESRIFATTTGTSGGSNTTAQVWRHTAARGAPIPVRNTTEVAEITAPSVGMTVTRMDVAGQPLEIWDGSAWNRAGTRVHANTQMVGAGMAANDFLTGTKRPWTQSGTTTATTDAAGNVAIGYPVAFANGVITAVVCNGDSNTGNLLMSISGAFTQNLTTLYVNVKVAHTGAVVGSASVRINWVAEGW